MTTSLIFKFRLLSDEKEDFLRDYEVPYEMYLSDFHEYIRRDLNFADGEMASFFKSDVEWEKLQEFTLLDMGEVAHFDPDSDYGAPVPMALVKLSQIMTEKFDRLVYVFDMLTERSLFVELIETKFVEEGATYPRTTQSQGTPPPQFLPEEEDIFGEMMGDFNDFEGDENDDDQ